MPFDCARGRQKARCAQQRGAPKARINWDQNSHESILVRESVNARDADCGLMLGRGGRHGEKGTQAGSVQALGAEITTRLINGRSGHKNYDGPYLRDRLHGLQTEVTARRLIPAKHWSLSHKWPELRFRRPKGAEGFGFSPFFKAKCRFFACLPAGRLCSE